MARCNRISNLLQTQKSKSHLIGIAFFLLLLTKGNSVFFNFSSFDQNNVSEVHLQGDAFINDGLQLTRNDVTRSLTSSVGRASYADPVQLWEARTGRLTDFTTHFSFTIRAQNTTFYGDGLSFYIAPFDSEIPQNSSGGFLGLFNPEDAFNSFHNNKSIIAVEFDSFENIWDTSSDHVGINVNSILSEVTAKWNSSIKDGRQANAWVSYNSTSKNLSVFLTYADNPVFSGNSSLSYEIDLRDFLPEKVRVGFSAATGAWVEIHNISSWSFNSTLDIEDGKGESRIRLTISLVVGFSICSLGLICFIYWRRRAARKEEEEDYDDSVDGEFGETGPKRFTYRELSHATNNFLEERKLGQGGFGAVYRGLLSESNIEVAIKRISKGSSQGKKEYVSEVKIISHLRHRNLVQLIGWCHTKSEFLLVYEFLPNGSLDFHLFGGKPALTWTVRYKIAHGLASSLLYLHEEWEQCVVHRDIKSSNVMLDSNFNAKLGDFGLARLADHELGLQTTVLAGTMGYMAPECVSTGKASKESDVYSFGIVVLEICCGRRPIERNVELSKVNLVEWVWNLYGNGQVLDAADVRLNTEFNEEQMKSLMVVGLWCCHPDPSFRPSIKQLVSVLNFEVRLPNLPPQLPKPMYYAPSMDMSSSFYSSSGTYLANSSKSEDPSVPLQNFSES